MSIASCFVLVSPLVSVFCAELWLRALACRLRNYAFIYLFNYSFSLEDQKVEDGGGKEASYIIFFDPGPFSFLICTAEKSEIGYSDDRRKGGGEK